MTHVRARRWRLGVGIALAAYVLSYVVLSFFGSYNADASGALRWWGGLAVTDVYVWEPRGMYYRERVWGGTTYVEANALGWFYSPLLLLDRAIVHPSGRYVPEIPKRGT